MKQRILAIDDEPDLLSLLERIIRTRTDYEIRTTNNSLEVPNILSNENFDVIITDLKMPGMDGLEILKYVKANNRTELVIMITAFGSLDTALDGLSLGVFDYITKPFKKEQIIFSLDRAMRFQTKLQQFKYFQEVFDITPLEEAVRVFKEKYTLFHAKK